VAISINKKTEICRQQTLFLFTIILERDVIEKSPFFLSLSHHSSSSSPPHPFIPFCDH